MFSSISYDFLPANYDAVKRGDTLSALNILNDVQNIGLWALGFNDFFTIAYYAVMDMLTGQVYFTFECSPCDCFKSVTLKDLQGNEIFFAKKSANEGEENDFNVFTDLRRLIGRKTQNYYKNEKGVNVMEERANLVCDSHLRSVDIYQIEPNVQHLCTIKKILKTLYPCLFRSDEQIAYSCKNLNIQMALILTYFIFQKQTLFTNDTGLIKIFH